MAATVRKRFTSDAAAQDLWRVAETDDVDELERVLPRIGDVNARNKHGMTALMRAAYHGHVRMARALLEHGADPNLARDDKFTALALAAFFGHTETVRILIDHGANREIVTRCGASAYMWATARTFEEAARCLESHTPTVPRARPFPVPAPALVPAPAPAAAPALAAAAPPVVKTLKDPPEIWDLVHEVPRSFNARSAFLSRLDSMNRGLAVCMLTGLLLVVGGGVGVLLYRGSPAVAVHSEVPTIQTATGKAVNKPSNAESATSDVSATAPEVEAKEPPVDAVSNHPRRVPTRQSKPRSTANEVVVENSLPREIPAKPATAASASPQSEKPKSSDTSARSKPATSLSPQLISPAQNSPPKAKVIQWP
jgi:hypothetical protein